MIQLTAPQQQVVDAINKLNKEQGVASALYVSALTGLSQTYTNQLCQSLKVLGVVTWEPNVPSLRVILEVTPSAAPAEDEETGDPDAEPDEDDEAERKKQARRDALARGRATAAANRAAKAAAAAAAQDGSSSS